MSVFDDILTTDPAHASVLNTKIVTPGNTAIGDLATLTTTDTSSLVNAINEVDGEVSSHILAATPHEGATLNDVAVTSYTEGEPAAQTHAASGGLTLNCEDGNIHTVTVEANITGVTITNASANVTTSITLRLVADGEYSIVWLSGTAIVTDSTGVSAANADNSFNSNELFADDLQMGDEITVTGFTDAEDELNGVHRVISATTSKIVVDTAITADEAAGQSVTITRHNLYGEGDAPVAYIPKYYTLWTLDGARWNIAEVGEF